MSRRLRRILALQAAGTLLGGACATLCASDPNVGWMEVRSAHFVVSSNAGEKEARGVADQFEQIRALFHAQFANLRVDPAQPVLILAAKNENTMKMLLPENWEVKGHVHPAGLYQQGEDKHYVLLQLDSAGDNPFHTLYHEYTHALLHLNFTGLPLWLDEGLAEFYGNSRLGEKESRVGTIDETHLYILGQNKLLPIETLLNVEQGSPFYNEQNRASVFYAESWALVHYLVMDPEAQKRQLLKNFLAAWNQGGTQIEAAQKTFGDLKRFGQVIEGYSRQRAFMVGVIKNGQPAADKSYTTRSLPAGEVLALRGDAATHRQMMEQARPLLEQALQAEPNLAMAHEAMGFYLYRKNDHGGADKEMKMAIDLGSTNFAPAYYHGMALLQAGFNSPEVVQEAVHSFEKATQINPQFAPAFEGLAQAYSATPETHAKAAEAGITAVKLDPTAHGYAVNLVYLLLTIDHDAEARMMAQKLLEKATSPEEAQIARTLLDRVKEHEDWVAQRNRRLEEAANQAKVVASPTRATAVANSEPVEEETPKVLFKRRVDPAKLMAADGLVRRVDCSHKPEVTVTLAGGTRPLIFHAADFTVVGVSGADEDTMDVESCEKWKGRRLRIWFLAVKSKDYMGEITDIAFQ